MDVVKLGLVVFLEVYYFDGWSVMIDGKLVDILCVDYIFCGLNMLVGKYKVVFIYILEKYYRFNNYLRIFFIVLFISGVFIGWLLLKRKKR